VAQRNKSKHGKNARSMVFGGRKKRKDKGKSESKKEGGKEEASAGKTTVVGGRGDHLKDKEERKELKKKASGMGAQPEAKYSEKSARVLM